MRADWPKSRVKLEWKLDCCSGGILSRIELCHTTVFIVANFRTSTLSFIRQEVGMRKYWMEHTQVGETMVKGEEIKPN